MTPAAVERERKRYLEEECELLERAAEVLRDVEAQRVRVARLALAPRSLQRRHAQRRQRAVQPVVVLCRGTLQHQLKRHFVQICLSAKDGIFVPPSKI